MLGVWRQVPDCFQEKILNAYVRANYRSHLVFVGKVFRKKSEIDVNVVRDFDCNYNKFRSTIAASWVGAWQLLPLQT